MRSNVSIRNTTRGSLPRVPFEAIAADILGSRYELSLVICGDTLSQRMNREYRKKSYRPNVLSFPLSKKEGEIFLNTACAKREAKRLSLRAQDRIAHLYIHGCLHLKGLPHGVKMDALEAKYLRQYQFAEPR